MPCPGNIGREGESSGRIRRCRFSWRTRSRGLTCPDSRLPVQPVALGSRCAICRRWARFWPAPSAAAWSWWKLRVPIRPHPRHRLRPPQRSLEPVRPPPFPRFRRPGNPRTPFHRHPFPHRSPPLVRRARPSPRSPPSTKTGSLLLPIPPRPPFPCRQPFPRRQRPLFPR